MKPAEFEMLRPESLEQALSLLEQRGNDAKLIAGGQSLVPVMNLRLATPGVLIDLNKVSELEGIRIEGDRLHIGAMTRQAALLQSPLVAKHAPLLVQALQYVGHVQTRSRGTVGGSIAHADPAAELPLAMVALDAHFTIASSRGRHSVPARGFFRDLMTTAIGPGELLAEIVVPMAPAGTRSTFREYARRHGDFAIVAVAAQLAAGKLDVAVGGLESVPRYLPQLGTAYSRQRPDVAALANVAREALSNAVALHDNQASAVYRRHLAQVLIGDCLDEVLPS